MLLRSKRVHCAFVQRDFLKAKRFNVLMAVPPNAAGHVTYICLAVCVLSVSNMCIAQSSMAVRACDTRWVNSRELFLHGSVAVG